LVAFTVNLTSLYQQHYLVIERQDGYEQRIRQYVGGYDRGRWKSSSIHLNEMTKKNHEEYGFPLLQLVCLIGNKTVVFVKM
jgi:hypothetical protein